MNLVLLFLAKYLIGIICLVLFIYWLTLPRKDKIRVMVFGVIAAIVAFTLSRIGSALYYDSRPFVDMSVTPLYPHEANNGFPSDHTLLAAVAAVTAYFASKKLGWFLFIGALLVGGSRILGYIHSPTDILGSLVFSAIGGVVAYYATPRILAAFKKRNA